MIKFAVMDERTEEVYTFSDGTQAMYSTYDEALKTATAFNRYSQRRISPLVEPYSYVIRQVMA